jgi:hypothetical protein
MILTKLTNRFKELKREGKSEESIIIDLKENLHHYILNFIYKHKNYSSFTMYGGTVLRIGYDLPRMSEDLDFQTNLNIDQEKFAKELTDYFKKDYGIDIEVKIDNRDLDTKMLFVKFDNILKNLNFESYTKTKLFVRVDINYFEKMDEFVNDTISVIRDDLAYTIKTYPLSTLMASKATAFLKRSERGFGLDSSNVKPRDVFDMIWYMERRIMPDYEYLKAQGIEFDNFLDFRDLVEEKATNIKDSVFEKDLAQFFFDINELGNFLATWKEKFSHLLNSYDVFKIKKLESIYLHKDFDTDVITIVYKFEKEVKFKIGISDLWFVKKIQLKNNCDFEKIKDKVTKYRNEKLTDLELEYVCFFYEKIQNYLKRSNNIVYQRDFTTKKILTISKDLDNKKEIWLDKKLLEKIQFEELL